jgi:ribosomal protein S18 acetylase RimI-like enzyme
MVKKLLVQSVSEKYIDQSVNVVEEYRKFCGFNVSTKGTKDFFKNIHKENKAATLIAISEEDEVMGFVNLYPSYSTLSLRKIWILNDLGVSSKFRRLGVAQALIKKSIEFAKETDAIRIELKTAKNNLNAQMLYSEIGFQTDKDNVYYRVPIK